MLFCELMQLTLSQLFKITHIVILIFTELTWVYMQRRWISLRSLRAMRFLEPTHSGTFSAIALKANDGLNKYIQPGRMANKTQWACGIVRNEKVSLSRAASFISIQRLQRVKESQELASDSEIVKLVRHEGEKDKASAWRIFFACNRPQRIPRARKKSSSRVDTTGNSRLMPRLSSFIFFFYRVLSPSDAQGQKRRAAKCMQRP